MEPDFSGWATKANLKCSDGRIIRPEAFAHMHGQKVPLVWQHAHGEPANVLGYAILSHKDGEGVWADGYFNETDSGKQGKALVQHKDVDSLSIYANGLVEKSKEVFHGFIREVSLVLSGANPGAKIMNIALSHSEFGGDDQVLEDEAIIFSGEELFHAEDGTSADPEKEKEGDQDAGDGDQDGEGDQEDEGEELDVQEVLETLDDDQKQVVHGLISSALEISAEAEKDGVAVHAAGTVQDVIDSFTEDQKKVLYYLLATAVEQATSGGDSAAHSSDNNEGDLTHQEGSNMKRNVFDQNGAGGGAGATDGLPELKHSDLEAINEKAKEIGSFGKAFIAHAESLGYGIDDIEFLFPDAKNVTSQPELIARRTEWVAGVIDGAKHSPFSRIKSLAADLTADEARARGYVKGSLKKDEVIKLLKRVTTPTTVYKKQKLDRDDIVDITDLDVVAWLKWEMRFMLEEEIARAILIGDGREPDDEDKIDEDKLRPIAWDNEMYAHPINVPSNTTAEGIVETVLRSRKNYKGTGTPTFYTTDDVLTDLLLIKNKLNDYVYKSETELAARLRVSNIVVVEVMENTPDLLGIIVNMADYTIGADRGGQLAMFEDFDIDYNQQKYLMETRISGALTKPKSALVLKRTSGTAVVAAVPAFDEETNELTIPTVAGVTYYDVTDLDEGVVLTPGVKTITRTTDVEARANANNSFAHNTDNDWTFPFNADA